MTTRQRTLEARECFYELRVDARRILSVAGERSYERWLENAYEYPLDAGMDDFDPRYDCAPLLRSEEQEIIDERDRRLGRKPQARLTQYEGVVAGGRKPVPAKRMFAKPAPVKAKQARMDQFMQKRNQGK